MYSSTMNFRNATVVKKPILKKGTTGDYLQFMITTDDIKIKDKPVKILIHCFDDEREKNPFKRLKAATEKGSVTEGTLIQMECVPSPYERKVLSDAFWRELSKGPNPTLAVLYSFKILDWDYLIPYEIHEKLKGNGNGKKIEPITVAQMGGSIL